MDDNLEIRRTPHDATDARALIIELNEAIWERYPDMRPGPRSEYEQGNVLEPDVAFFVAYQNEEPVGCGAFRPKGDDAVEIKRMFVRSTARGRGLGRAILAHLERSARSEGYRVARLETGTGQTEAIALYEREGYRRIACWPPYDELPISVCYEKALEPAP